jgi:miniconductance mechanosensitive channel
MITYFQNWAEYFGLSSTLAQTTAVILTSIVIVILSLLAYFVAKKIILPIISKVIKKSNSKWAQTMFSSKVLSPLAHLAPALTLHAMAINFPDHFIVLQHIAKIYMVLVGIRLLKPTSRALETIYNRSFKVARKKPITGYLELVQIFLTVIGIILIISILMNQSPAKLLAGIGALTAILLLIFRDTILGFVAAIKVSSADMVRIGDWIEMPKYGADGDVIEINLTAIKVQNFDKTIVMIPTYLLVSESFKNWRGMEQAGGRRIKRAVHIDMTSVKFLDDALVRKLEKVHLLKEYVTKRQLEITDYNEKNQIDTSQSINGRRMTNLGTFRAYLAAFLREHPLIHNDLTFLIRQLSPSEKGLPLEIYVFTTDTRWSNYEAIQADIFDHVLAVLPEFDLRVFQNPTGKDFQALQQ